MTEKILATLATLALLTAAPVHAQDTNAEDDAIIGASGAAHADTDVQASSGLLTAEGRLGKMEAVAAVFAEMAGMKTVVDGCS